VHHCKQLAGGLYAERPVAATCQRGVKWQVD